MEQTEKDSSPKTDLGKPLPTALVVLTKYNSIYYSVQLGFGLKRQGLELVSLFRIRKLILEHWDICQLIGVNNERDKNTFGPWKRERNMNIWKVRTLWVV